MNMFNYALLATAFAISTCGLIYELIAGTVASYLLGDSVTQFSTVIGVYLFSMGVGSFLTRYIEKGLVGTFVCVELLVALIGGCSAASLFLLFDHVESFRVLLYGIVSVIGILVGVEIPLLMRILQDRLEFKDLVSQIFTFDYVGALFASLLFPLILVPYLGLVRTCFLFGLLNDLVAVWTVYLFRKDFPWLRRILPLAVLLAIGLVSGFVLSERLLSMAESSTFPDPVIYSKNTPYQRIVITSNGKDTRLFLNGNLQFSSRDEYRYHEALVHPAMSAIKQAHKVLVLGGGDGMAVRELLKYPSVQSITLVDLDSQMTELFKSNSYLSRLNDHSLQNSRVKIINQDAFTWLRKCGEHFDCVVADFPDPSNFSIGKLYSATFYKVIKHVLHPDGLIVIQSTSPYYAKNSFWCVVNTLKSVGLIATPYHAYVPSFGDWGYVIGSFHPFETPAQYPSGLRYVTSDTVAEMLHFPKDMLPTVSATNQLNNQALVHLFESEWGEYVDTH